MVALFIAALCWPAGAGAHGEPHLYESIVQGIQPPTAAAGIEVRMIDFDSQVELTNRSDETVIVEGYEGEPYLRIDANGSVFLNAKSPSMAPSNDRMGKTEPTGDEDAKATPNWIRVAHDGSFRWFDRRTQYRKAGVPKVVTDEAARTLVWRWQIPMSVGDQAATINGELFWLGRRPFPTGVLLVILLATAGCGLFGAWALRRMREESEDPDEPA